MMYRLLDKDQFNKNYRKYRMITLNLYKVYIQQLPKFIEFSSSIHCLCCGGHRYLHYCIKKSKKSPLVSQTIGTQRYAGFVTIIFINNKVIFNSLFLEPYMSFRFKM